MEINYIKLYQNNTTIHSVCSGHGHTVQEGSCSGLENLMQLCAQHCKLCTNLRPVFVARITALS